MSSQLHNALIVVIFGALLLALPAGAADDTPAKQVRVQLQNGDSISGTLTADEKDQLVLQTEAAGIVTLRKAFVKEVQQLPTAAPPPGAEEKHWKTSAFLGYSLFNGNTDKAAIAMSVGSIWSADNRELDLKGTFNYGETDGETDTLKWFTQGRCGKSLVAKKWSTFGKLEMNGDRYADIELRLTPAAGIGYTFFDAPPGKVLVELAIGLDHTRFQGEEAARTEGTLIPRLYLQKNLFDSTVLAQDIFLYPSLSYFGRFRLRAETSLKTPLSPLLPRISLNMSFIDEYNSHPADPTIKNNDAQFLTSVGYTY